MTRIRHYSLALAIVAGLLGAAVALPAHAQSIPTTRNYTPTVKSKPQAIESNVPPPGLPGAVSNGTPAEKTALDLPPTEALFDAINRGDIASARDAISRGADLTGRNILGMTPLELSVDLSRNDITFLLLSLRGTSPAAAPATQAATKTAVATQPPSPVAAKHHVKVAVKVARPAPVAVPPAPPPVPRQYAGPSDTGVADPQAGFLGFGRSVQ
jgi:hypothetical protein